MAVLPDNSQLPPETSIAADACSLADDPAPGVKIGDFVQAKAEIADEEFEVAMVGDVGRVIAKEFDVDLGWCLPTVRFERTGRAYDVTPEEIDVMAEAGFASSESTTPKKPRRLPIKRGAQ